MPQNSPEPPPPPAPRLLPGRFTLTHARDLSSRSCATTPSLGGLLPFTRAPNQLEEVVVNVCDFMEPFEVANFHKDWDDVGELEQHADTFALSAFKSLQGMGPGPRARRPPSRVQRRGRWPMCGCGTGKRKAVGPGARAGGGLHGPDWQCRPKRPQT